MGQAGMRSFLAAAPLFHLPSRSGFRRDRRCGPDETERLHRLRVRSCAGGRSGSRRAAPTVRSPTATGSRTRCARSPGLYAQDPRVQHRSCKWRRGPRLWLEPSVVRQCRHGSHPHRREEQPLLFFRVTSGSASVSQVAADTPAPAPAPTPAAGLGALGLAKRRKRRSCPGCRRRDGVPGRNIREGIAAEACRGGSSPGSPCPCMMPGQRSRRTSVQQSRSCIPWSRNMSAARLPLLPCGVPCKRCCPPRPPWETGPCSRDLATWWTGDRSVRSRPARMDLPTVSTPGLLLYGIVYGASRTIEAQRRDLDRPPDELQEVRKALEQAMTEIRAEAGSLLPQIAGLSAAQIIHMTAEAHQERTGRPVDLVVEGDGMAPPAPALQVCLFRFAQGGLNNVRRHASGAHLTVILSTGAAGLRLSVGDHGPGLAPDSNPPPWPQRAA